jgi:hypothetical protein
MFLMVIGAFVFLCAILAVIGPTLEGGGLNVTGFVTSVPGAFLTGAALFIIGLLLRRRALAKGQTTESK